MTVKELKEFLDRKFIDDDDVIQIALYPDDDVTYDIGPIRIMGRPDNRVILIGEKDE